MAEILIFQLALKNPSVFNVLVSSHHQNFQIQRSPASLYSETWFVCIRNLFKAFFVTALELWNVFLFVWLLF